MVAQWYNLRFETLETRVRTLPWASSGHVTTRSMSLQHLRSHQCFASNLWKSYESGTLHLLQMLLCEF